MRLTAIRFYNYKVGNKLPLLTLILSWGQSSKNHIKIFGYKNHLWPLLCTKMYFQKSYLVQSGFSAVTQICSKRRRRLKITECGDTRLLTVVVPSTLTWRSWHPSARHIHPFKTVKRCKFTLPFPITTTAEYFTSQGYVLLLKCITIVLNQLHYLLHCVLAVAQCIVISPVCVLVCGCDSKLCALILTKLGL